MAKILCLETATTNCSVAIGIDGSLVASKEENHQSYSHSEKLHVFVEEVVASAGLKLSDLEAIAVGMGPGSYTGLRIGVSAAKGLCFSLDLPLLAIPTLQSMAMQLHVEKGDIIIPVLDARRMEVYSCIFDHNYNEIRKTEAEIINANSFETLVDSRQIHLVGNGAEKCNEILPSDTFYFYPEIFPSAKEMVPLSEEKYQKGDFQNVAYFEPFYLKDFILQKKK